MTQGNSTKLIIPQLIIGLGNPEPKYEQTRHNIGFEATDSLSKVLAAYLAEKSTFSRNVCRRT